jgi:hypothetical protein
MNETKKHSASQPSCNELNNPQQVMRTYQPSKQSMNPQTKQLTNQSTHQIVRQLTSQTTNGQPNSQWARNPRSGCINHNTWAPKSSNDTQSAALRTRLFWVPTSADFLTSERHAHCCAWVSVLVHATTTLHMYSQFRTSGTNSMTG